MARPVLPQLFPCLFCPARYRHREELLFHVALHVRAGIQPLGPPSEDPSPSSLWPGPPTEAVPSPPRAPAAAMPPPARPPAAAKRWPRPGTAQRRSSGSRPAHPSGGRARAPSAEWLTPPQSCELTSSPPQCPPGRPEPEPGRWALSTDPCFESLQPLVPPDRTAYSSLHWIEQERDPTVLLL